MSTQKISEKFDASARDGENWDVVVIGTGYGGGVSASRLAASGQKVLVLERGREIRPGQYPNDPTSAMGEMQITVGETGETVGRLDGMYDLRVGDDMNVIMGCGLGGTSLINANVSLQVDKRVFTDLGWPKVFRDEPGLLDPFYEKARVTLGANPFPEGRDLPKLKALKKSASAFLDDDSNKLPFVRPPINVTFKDGENAVGEYQSACNMCGDCCSGCNYGAKNTTLMNYLPDAVKRGATIVNCATAEWVEKTDNGWRVRVRETVEGGEAWINAAIVVVSAGTLGSNEIMHRSKEKGLAISDRVGQNFSGNGDVLAFGYNAKDPIYGVGAGAHMPGKEKVNGSTAPYMPGPCITGMIDLRDTPNVRDGLVIQEGVMPGAMSAAYSATFFMLDAFYGNVSRYPDSARRMKDAQALGDMIKSDPAGLVQAAYSGPMAHTQTYLVMSHDSSSGVIEMKHNRATVSWPDAGEDLAIIHDNDVLQRACDPIWAEYLSNPIWDDGFGKKLVSVHPVGGCQMGDDPAHGVVNDRCQVFDTSGQGAADHLGNAVHAGLYVCDGSVLPGAVGVNPLLTISAVTERAMHHLAEEHAWTVATAKLPRLVTEAEKAEAALPRHRDLSKLDWWIWSVKKAIGTGFQWPARSAIMFGYRRFFKSMKPEIADLPAPDVIEKWIQNPSVITDLIGPMVDNLYPILSETIKDIDGRHYGALFKMLENKMGDFSPPLSFSEKMEGAISKRGIGNAHVISDPYKIAGNIDPSSRDETDAYISVKVETDHLRAMIEDPSHTARITGEVHSALLGEFTIDGTFNLLASNPDVVECWNMIYEGPLVPKGDGPKGLYFRGFKTLQKRPGSAWWRDVTVLSVDIFADESQSEVIARGILTLGTHNLIDQAQTLNPSYLDDVNALQNELGVILNDGRKAKDVAKLVAGKSLRAKIVKYILLKLDQHNHDPKSQAEKTTSYVGYVEKYYLANFAAIFAGLVFRAYGEVFAYMSNFAASDNLARLAAQKPKRQITAPTPEYFYPLPDPENKDLKLQLTRYKGGDKGPILVAGGFGTRASAFATETVDVNFVEKMSSNGYDVWLFDYRGSGAIKASETEFTIDDVAKQDWPAAIKMVLDTTGKKDLQVVVHCVASLSLLMSLLSGTKGVRSVVSSQLTLHPITNWFNFAKADAKVARIVNQGVPEGLKKLINNVPQIPEKFREIMINGLPVVNVVTPWPYDSADNNANDETEQAMNFAIYNLPSFAEAPCSSPTCHRITAIYGPSYNHDQLNEATHNAIGDMFGPVNTLPFVQLAQIFRRGEAVSADGTYNYMEHHTNLNLPIHFLAGSQNFEILPSTSLKTLDWLKKVNPESAKSGLYSRTAYPAYGHMDIFIGKNSAVDIFDDILVELDRYN